MFSKSDRLSEEYMAAVGVFDGLHRGHRAILGPLIAEARDRRLPSILFSFQPRPVTVFAPGTPPDELTPPPRKWRLLAEAGLDRVVVLRFSRRFAEIEAEDFLTEVLGAGRGLRGIWVGHDFRFGRRRRGRFEMLAAAGERFGFDVIRRGPVRFGGVIVSSTKIRQHMRLGEIGAAARLLGRWPDLEGIVVHGQGIGGRDLVATANLSLPETQCLPAAGVYAGEAEWEGRYLPAVMNVGRRPTLTDGRQLVAEVHILGFRGDLRGRRLLFRLRDRLREERNFSSLKELKDQIEADIARTRLQAVEWEKHDSDLVNGNESW